jgi:hypothetical protein
VTTRLLSLFAIMVCVVPASHAAALGASPVPTAPPTPSTPVAKATFNPIGQPVSGTSLDVVDLAPSTGDALTVVLASPYFLRAPGDPLGDPQAAGTSLEMISDSGDTATFSFRPSAWSWDAEARRWRYVPDENDPVRSASVDTEHFALTAALGGLTLDEPTQQRVRVFVNIGMNRYCAAFGGRSVVTDTVGRFAAANAAAPTECANDGSPVTFAVSPAVGIAPVTVTYSIASDTSISTYTLDPNALGLTPQTDTARSKAITYDNPGRYYPRIAVADPHGRTHFFAITLQIWGQGAVDDMVLSTWAAMKSALRSGNIEEALLAFAPRRREEYRRVFQSLTVPLAEIDQVLGDIKFVAQRGRLLEYEMLRGSGSARRSFAVIFERDAGDVWRVSSM